MKATITEEGTILLLPETSLEKYAADKALDRATIIIGNHKYLSHDKFMVICAKGLYLGVSSG